ncbi:hypothetical protein A5699_08435 [Mycobacterium sp. E802]|uniref:hypothetical protein n=1 Tax=Mycobacterium sp. E802 TaxID=1834152 RepID=UPI0007FF1951|nr:hypothetical protein [Mycobacterium sp. E802]OBG81678.1 hypothetical protein A5699_08435 [Mycobacterium sp. E802]
MGIAKVSASLGVTLAVLTAGCAERSDDFKPNNRGEDTETVPTSVDNAYIVPEHAPDDCAIQVGDNAELRFTATNSRPTGSERLLSIATEAADAVRMGSDGGVEIAPKSSKEITAAVEGLREGVRPATSVDVTFTFDQSGDISVRVPIEACPAQQG